MDGSLLHVLHCILLDERRIPDVLRCMRRAASGDHAVLLLCDLGRADARELPGDAPMLHKLQSGVMAMNAKGTGEFHLLVRRRTWDDAERAYLGAERKTSCREAVAQLVKNGETDTAFSAATIAPSSFKDRFEYILFSDLSLSCTPDIPRRMANALERSSAGCLCARVLEKKDFPQTALTRLCTFSSFSLSPFCAARKDRLRRRGQGSADGPTIYTAEALAASVDQPITCAPVAENGFFVRRKTLTLPDFFREHRRFCLQGSRLHALLPVLQLFVLILCGVAGQPWLTALAILPAELWAILHPRLLPGALLRLALLPLTACVSLDALLCRLLARSKLVRLRIPETLITPQGCMLFGAALLPAALYSAQALVPLLPVCLLWLAAPLIVSALDAPTLERIPLDGDQRRQLRALAEAAFFDSANAAAQPPFRMLCACAGCMLGQLEPDEAAREAKAQLETLKEQPLSAHDLAALLASAQFLRERMGDCDAALRELPADIERRALSLPLAPTSGRLRALLAAALQELSAPQALDRLARNDTTEPSDLLFLPMQSVKHTPVYPVSLPLTHPHTFLQRQRLAPGASHRPVNAAQRFLFLSAAALGHPFHALLERSPVAGPYMLLLSV